MSGILSQIAFALAAWCVLLAGCAVSSERARCEPGAEIACTCASGASGLQRCEDEGTYGACSCADAGTTSLEAGTCFEGQTATCECSVGRSGLTICRGGTWSECECPLRPGDRCEVPSEPAPSPRPRQREGEDLYLRAGSGPTEIWATSDAYVGRVAQQFVRVEREDRRLSFEAIPDILAVARRGPTLYVVSPDRVATYDEHLSQQSSAPVTEWIDSCSMLACPLWVCMPASGAGYPLVLSPVTGELLAATSAFGPPLPLTDAAAFVDQAGYAEHDALGLITRRTPFDLAYRDRYGVLGVAPHRVLATGNEALDVEACVAGDESRCLSPRFRFGTDGRSPNLYASGGDVALAAGNGELVVVDLATGLGTARALAGVVGSESVELLALAYDPWAEQAVLAFRRCETCEVLLRFADVEAP
jgi:hypothetical protein